MANFKPSQLFFDLVKAQEGLRLIAYLDSAGISTIGYGSTYYPNGTKVKMGDKCTEQQAQGFMLYAAEHFVQHLNATITSDINQAQFDALLDFCYNCGQGAWDQSSLRGTVNCDPTNYELITANFCKWDKIHRDGQLVEAAGLLRRRKCEAYLYQYGSNHPTFFEEIK